MKTCKICHQTKPFSGFYRNPRMADGHFNECADCYREKNHANYIRRMQDPEIREAQMARDRERGRRRLAQGERPKPEVLKLGRSRWASSNPDKCRAHRQVHKAIKAGTLVPMPCEKCGAKDASAHHDDYSKPLQVRWLCAQHHAEHHVEMRRLERQKKSSEQAPH